MRRRHLLCTALSATLLLGLSTPMAVAADLAKVSLRLKWLPQASFAGYYVALEKGYYAEEGLDLTINPSGPNLLTENLVATGADTFGLSGGTDSFLAARAKDMPIVCIGVAHQLTPFVFVTRADGPVETVQDFRGKTVTAWFTGANYVLSAMLAAEGVAPGEVDIQPQQVSMTPFIDGQVDVATVTRYNEYYQVMTAMGAENLRTFDPEDYGVSFPRDTLITSEDFAAEHPELVEGFLRATARGWVETFHDKPGAIDVIMALAPTLDRAHQEYTLDKTEELMLGGAAATEGMFAIDLTAIAKAHQLLVDYSVIDAPVDLDAAFLTGFIDAIPADARLP